jgi:hypothetical protein
MLLLGVLAGSNLTRKVRRFHNRYTKKLDRQPTNLGERIEII